MKQWQFSNSQWLNQGQGGVAQSNAWHLVVQSAIDKFVVIILSIKEQPAMFTSEKWLLN